MASYDTAIDDVHIDLIVSMAKATNTKHVLELGYGTGRVTRRLQEVLSLKTHLVVDNWLDWNYVKPSNLPIYPKVEYWTDNEYHFVGNCTRKFDLIISDADHFRAELWTERTLSLLTNNGVAFFHDVTNSNFPNLATIITQIDVSRFSKCLFNTNYYQDDNCTRGLLMVTKL